MAHHLFERRVLFVVGKGGVGKSTVAALLAVALAARGKRVLLAQMGPGRRLGEVLGVDGAAEAPAEVFPGLCFLAIDGEKALGEYLALVLPVKRVHRVVVGSKLYHHFVAAAPGLKELMTVGKIWYEEQLESSRGRKWDAMIA